MPVFDRVALWDVTRGGCVEHLAEGRSYEEALRDLSHKPQSHTASWFSSSARSGTIEVRKLGWMPWALYIDIYLYLYIYIYT